MIEIRDQDDLQSDSEQLSVEMDLFNQGQENPEQDEIRENVYVSNIDGDGVDNRDLTCSVCY